jgi:PAS domain S-box-containing protein
MMRALLVGVGTARAVVAQALAERGHSIVADVGHFEEALRVAVDPCELVLAGGRASLETCLAIRGAPACLEAAILILVDEDDVDVSIEARLLAGADDFLSLPVDATTFRRRLLVAERTVAWRAMRKATEAERRRKAQDGLLQTTAMLNSIADGVIACDLMGTIVRMNPVAETLTGWASNEALGCPLIDVFKVVDEETRTLVESPVGHALRSRTAVSFPTQAVLLRRDGTELPISDSCAPILTDEGGVSGAVLVFRDVHAEREARAVHEATQQQLQSVERMASVGRLAAGVAHEINNPLASVMSNLHMVLEEMRTFGDGSGRMAELLEMVREAQEGAERVRKIVRGLRTFSRGADRHAVIDLVPLLETSIKMAFHDVPCPARLAKDFGDAPLVDADDARLGEVFTNLLVNAAQAFRERDSDANEIRVSTSTDLAGRAVVEVRNTGPAIPRDVIERIFDPFFTTKPVGVGTGLGLSICQNIVNGMGGTISVVSDETHGTTFRVVLPAASLQELAVRHAAPMNPTRPPGATVLIVDDDPGVGAALGRLLRQHDVTVATRAQQALKLLDSGKTFDIVFSDLMMPEMSGMDFYHEVAQRFPALAERIVFITGGAFTRGGRAFLDCVPNMRLEKPFDPKMVRALVEERTRTSGAAAAD